jgi:hypothetical protein
MKRSNTKSSLPERVTALESRLSRLMMVLLTGGFIVMGGLLSIIAALLALGPR